MSKTTDTKLPELTSETCTVEINQELQTAVVKSNKHKAEFLIGKSRASRFFFIRVSQGNTPNDLLGKFTSLEVAVETVLNYVKHAKETFSVKSERLHQERQQRKNAELKPENS